MTKEELIRDEDYSETDAEIMVLKNKLDKANERIEELEQENQQLLETSKAYKKLLKTTMQKEHQAIKVLDEIRAYIKDTCYYPELENYSNMTSDEVIELMDILDKVIK